MATYNPHKEMGLVMVEGRPELPPEDEEEEEPKEFEMPDDGKRYGGAFVARPDLVKRVSE